MTETFKRTSGRTSAASVPSEASIVRAVDSQVIALRRHFHAHPELSNREVQTAARVAAELESLGLEVVTGIAHTGVVGYLRGAAERPLVAVRADMDALPVTEQVDLPFASTARATYRGQEVGVMHACGHDAHMAIALGVARVLSEASGELPGSVMFIFQPAEEGAPDGEQGGAELMLEEGLFENRRPDAVFGLHVFSDLASGVVGYRAGPIMAAQDRFEIVVNGRQSHGARPWAGVDPIVVAAQIIVGAQSIVSRQVDITRAPAVLSFGAVNGGVRNNIIPDSVQMIGTIRNFDMEIRDSIHARLETTAVNIAEAAGATADVQIFEGYPVTVNDPELARRMRSTLERLVGADRIVEPPLRTGAEDFSFFAREVPGLYVYLGVTPPGVPVEMAPSNHSPLFYVHEEALATGVRVLTHFVVDYMTPPGG